MQVTRGSRYYPVAVNLNGKRALVVGGGRVAERKVGRLLAAGAFVVVVSPALTSGLSKLKNGNKITWERRKVSKKDVAGKGIIIAASNDQKVNAKLSQWAQQKKIWHNVVDNPRLSDFISPAVFKADRAYIAVYTNGRDPVLSRDLKNFLKENWDEFLSYRKRLQKHSD